MAGKGGQRKDLNSCNPTCTFQREGWKYFMYWSTLDLLNFNNDLHLSPGNGGQTHRNNSGPMCQEIYRSRGAVGRSIIISMGHDMCATVSRASQLCARPRFHDYAAHQPRLGGMSGCNRHWQGQI
ncbi:predicted protein [Verticillium alfalfae VaMs.102]|uniref:Predicted protein n=1 Tax=Verticillium alfalfae (strain VaMs.102 / ATCC MYA-4576 / FGSC 10136) TaxID=526221 RepID=C9SLK6_VERA1|nr:predicted protein [Verticillium alfalfae VaMs.102]EEY19574.1 predicted protein [Verticillium alfalfae VaMs.102]